MYLALEQAAPEWRTLRVYEAGPAGALSHYLGKHCPGLTTSFFLPDVPRGHVQAGRRSENLERLTFESETFDIVITQDVLEHVWRPELALAEIGRVLRPGGLHIFTVPYTPTVKTRARARAGEDDELQLLEPAEYHGDPLNPRGVLVVTDWGEDLSQIVWNASGLRTEVQFYCNRAQGIPEHVSVFTSRKTRHPPPEKQAGPGLK